MIWQYYEELMSIKDEPLSPNYEEQYVHILSWEIIDIRILVFL